MTQFAAFATALFLAVLLIAPPHDSPASALSIVSFASAEAREEPVIDLDADAVGTNVNSEQCDASGKCKAKDNTAIPDEAKVDDDSEDVLDDVEVEDDEDVEEENEEAADFDAEEDEDDDEDFDEEDEDEENDTEASDEKKGDKPAVLDPPNAADDTSYEVPPAKGAIFFDSFQGDLSQWVHTSDPDYNGKFAQGQGAAPIFPGDRALIIPQKARKYGLAAAIDGMSDMGERTLVVQYEVKMDEGMTCGGAYVKLPLPEFHADKFNGDTPYSVMYGPDKCGLTNKVHFIFQSEHPTTGKRREHHLKDPPSVPNAMDKKTHLYTIVVREDGTFELNIDGQNQSNGTLSENFEPPVQMEKEIDDPKDKKPKDWVDAKQIPDPAATKPDDWDENAPLEIPDEEAVKPEGWLDDEPKQVSDPNAKKPDDWDEEEDGEWEAPQVDNPKCDAVGCGEWKRPMKKNPDYKGKWTAPLIDNPKYIGEWKPRKIENPDYYDVDAVHLLGIGGVGFELWTMDQGILFDNIWIGSDKEAADSFAELTFKKKQAAETEQEEKLFKEREAKLKAKREQKKKDKEAKKAAKKAASTQGDDDVAGEDDASVDSDETSNDKDAKSESESSDKEDL